MIRFLIPYTFIIISLIVEIFAISMAWYISKKNLNDQGLVGIALIGFFAVIFLIQNFYLKSVWFRKTRYASVFGLINEGFAEIHEIDRLQKPSAERKLEALEKMLNAVSETFRVISANECFACIKVLTGDERRYEVLTLCRDSKSKNKRPLWKNDDIAHYVDSNTALKYIVTRINEPHKRFFVNNFLPFLDGYQNTRIIGDDYSGLKSIPLLGPIVKLLIWSLPYRSTIVVPIVPHYFNSPKSTPYLAGFLCVDSPALGVFRKNMDLPILQGFSDGLYNKLHEYYSLY